MDASPTASLLPASPELTLCPPTEPMRYEAVACWESYVGPDTYQTSTLTKHISLRGQPLADGRVALTFDTAPPVLTKPRDLESMETLALRLAVLYAQVVVEASPTGRFVALLNHEALLQTWQRLAQSLRDSTTAEDRITPSLLHFGGQLLQEPANVLRSLGHDYVYAALVPALYAQPLAALAQPVRTREFSEFFDKLPLHFHEQVVVVPKAEATAPAPWCTLVCQGTLDAQLTDVAAIAALMAKALGPARGLPADPATGQPLAPHFHYAATHMLDPATGLPESVDLKVYARLGQVYNKQYTLTITRLS